jgi:hypothetical protein
MKWNECSCVGKVLPRYTFPVVVPFIFAGCPPPSLKALAGKNVRNGRIKPPAALITIVAYHAQNQQFMIRYGPQ